VATVDGVTVAEADRIDKKHISALGIAGSTLSLTRENGSVLSAALPAAAAGGPISNVLLETPTVTEVQSGSGATSFKTAYFDEWNEDLQSGPSLGILSPAGSMSWSWAEEGWYQIAFKLWMGFQAGALALPTMAHLSFTSWFGMAINAEIPLTAPSPVGLNVSNRTAHGAIATITTAPFFGPGAAEAAAVDGPNNLVLKWDGDASLRTANSGPATGGHAVTMNIARLA
jgi:hypothetical protein